MDDQELEIQDPTLEIPAVPADPVIIPEVLTPDVAPTAASVVAPGPDTDMISGLTGLGGLIERPLDPQAWANLGSNLTNAAYPINIATGQPMAPASDPVPTTNQPALVSTPIVQQQKVGAEQTQQLTPTPEGALALQDLRDTIAMGDTIAQGRMALEYELGAEQQKIDAARAQAAEAIDRRSQEIVDISKQELQASMDRLNKLRTQLENTSWQSYWGSKDTGDKVMLGLAVGLGALAQSQIGGQNLAMAVLQSTMEDHETTQRQNINLLTDRLAKEGTTATQTQQALGQAHDLLKASSVVKYDMLDKQLASIQSKLKTEDGVLKVQEMRQKLKTEQLNKLLDIEKDYALNTTKTRDVFTTKVVDASNAPVRSDGQLMDADQRKELLFAVDFGYAARTLEELEDSQVTKSKKYHQVRNAMLNEARSLGPIAGLVSAAEAAANFGVIRDKYIAGDPELQKYFRYAQVLMDARLRKVTGATINPGEYISEMFMMLPLGAQMNLGDAAMDADIADAKKVRRQKIQSARDISMSPAKLWFEVSNAGK